MKRPAHLHRRQTSGAAFGEAWTLTPITGTVGANGRATLAPGTPLSFRGATHLLSRGRTLGDEGRRIRGMVRLETVDAAAVAAALDRTGRHPPLLQRDDDETGDVWLVLDVDQVEPGRAIMTAERVLNRASLGDAVAAAVGI